MSRPTVESFRYGSVPGDGPFLPRSSSYTRPSQPQQPPQLLDNAGETFQTLADFILSLPHPRYWPGLLISFFLLDPLRSLATTFIGLVTSPRTHRVVLRLSILASLFYAALILAILAYVGFYQAWVPDVGRMEELYLQYGQAGEVPYAEVDLARWRGLGRSAVGDDWFAEEQEYDVNVELLVPISAANLDLGRWTLFVHPGPACADTICCFVTGQATSWSPSTFSLTIMLWSSGPRDLLYCGQQCRPCGSCLKLRPNFPLGRLWPAHSFFLYHLPRRRSR